MSELQPEVAKLRERLAEMQSEVARSKQAEQDLRSSEKRLRTIFEHSNDSIFLVDVEHEAIIDVNRKACRMLGYSREELLSIPMSAVHPHEMPKVRAFAKLVFERGEGFTDELTCLTKSGKFLAAEMSGSIIEFEDRTCMIASVRDVTERNRLALENEYLSGEIREEARFGSIIGRSPGILKVLQQIEMVAPTDTTVLILGESGTGKELVSRAIHDNSSREKHAMVRVNCASIPTELFESEFFGHVKGAFTGAVTDRPGRFDLADRGTLFLDEVGEIPLGLQGMVFIRSAPDRSTSYRTTPDRLAPLRLAIQKFFLPCLTA